MEDNIEKDLTVKETYLAMVIYLKNLRLRAGDDYVIDFSFLSDLRFSLDGGTMDPAAWYDWLDAISEAQIIETPPGRELTVKEGYLTMLIFLDDLYKRTNADDLNGSLGNLLLDLGGDITDPALWDDWLNAVKKVNTTPLKELIKENIMKFV